MIPVHKVVSSSLAGPSRIEGCRDAKGKTWKVFNRKASDTVPLNTFVSCGESADVPIAIGIVDGVLENSV